MQATISNNEFHPVTRAAARILSVILHPVFIPIYVLLFFLYLSPEAPALAPFDRLRITLSFSLMYIVFPVVTTLIAKGLGFIDSIMFRTSKDRIIPYVACGLFYFWMWYVLKNQPEFPKQLVAFSLGVFLASSGGLIANSYLKVSMHTIAAGVACTFICLLGLKSDANFGFFITIAVLLTGLICTIRLINTDHNVREVYIGLAIGVMMEIIAFWFV
ncbi:MAG: hypothetical protein C4330_11175 [Chitinophagaceae bacterium]